MIIKFLVGSVAHRLVVGVPIRNQDQWGSVEGEVMDNKSIKLTESTFCWANVGFT